jgi:hypothetical protein
MDWKNKEMWLTGLDVKSADTGPSIPWEMRSFGDEDVKEGYYFDPASDDFRSAFRDDWDKDAEIYLYAISSSDMIVIGGPIASLRADYFNDFTDAKVFTEYGNVYYSPACWARTTQDHYQGKILVDVEDDELWYSSPTVDDNVGYVVIATYKDLNETVGFIVYVYTA